MLAALIGILFLGGSSTQLLENIDAYQDRVKTVISDSDRRKEALTVLKSMEKRTKSRNKMVKNTNKQLSKLLGDHGVADAELDTVWDGYMQGIEAYHRDMIDIRFDLKQHVSKREWETIFAERSQP